MIKPCKYGTNSIEKQLQLNLYLFVLKPHEIVKLEFGNIFALLFGRNVQLLVTTIINVWNESISMPVNSANEFILR
jgi:hypothetical protein